jgi:hypothetical protein
VSEREEFDITPSKEISSTPPTPPKNRSRSPMKKMFGQGGWLGESPDEVLEHNLRPKKFNARSNATSPNRKKTTMIGKIKNKLEEIVSSQGFLRVVTFTN